jgi:hypothetical protein
MAVGSAPHQQRLHIVVAARQTASRWCAQVPAGLKPLERFLLGRGDPRLASPDISRLASLFSRHFKSSRGLEVREIRDALRVGKAYCYDVRLLSVPVLNRSSNSS